MKIKNYKLKATIPTCSYGNLQPEIEVDSTDIDKASEFALEHIKELHSRFSDTELKETARTISSQGNVKSFNEDYDILFDPIQHIYKTYDGNILESGSVYASSFYSKFDAQGIAKNCEKSWGVKAKDIVSMWESNGSLSSDFGTVVHKALEHYFNHEDTSDVIADNKDDNENRAMPKHPILKSIIEGFIKIDKYDCEKKCEVLVTDVKNLRCGTIDRLLILDKDKKVCRVQDYKINVGSETESSNLKAKAPYNELPKNKLTKYQIQLSFYAEILKQSGWDVTGIDIFVYENEWKHYPMELLEIN